MAIHPLLLEKLNQAIAPLLPPASTPRDARLPAVKGKAHAVTGMRCAGKTTFLRQLQASVRETLPPERALYISFDDDRIADLELDQLSLLLEEYYRRQPETRGRQVVHWFFDEIQLVDGWERFVRRVLDTERVEIVVSGSSARMLSREVHTSLRGRGMETVIRPFSFREFLRHRGEEPDEEARRWTAAERSLVEKRFLEFLAGGGFPEAQGIDRPLRVQLLQGYVDAVLFRDIVERHQVSQVAALRWLTRHCLRNPAGSFSVNRFYNDLKAQGHAVSKDAVHDLLGYLVDAFLISTVSVATESERRRNTNPRKIYPVDPGLIGAFDAGGRSNVGYALECTVMNEIERRGGEVAYVKTAGGWEVDFLVHRADGKRELIQVCADPSSDETADRELRALAAAAREHPRVARRLLVLTRDQTLGIEAKGVAIEPVYEWILATGA